MIGIVGGSSLLGSDMFASLAPQHVATSHGPVVVHIGTNIAFVQRHKTKVDQHYELPHDVRHAAIAEAFCVLGVTVVFGVCSVGSLTARVPPGSVCVCDDYFNIWGVRSGLRDERAHIAPGYDKEMREVIVRVVSEAGLVAHPGTYVQTTGPRFETKAEVRFLASVGDVVGMTGADEATHLQERGVRYAVLCMADNWANGVNSDFELSLTAFRDLVKKNEHTVQTLVESILKEAVKLAKT